jgi:acetyl-CoA decarbonylase/synthase complex subunit gamma
MIAVKNESGDIGKFKTLVEKVKAETDAAIILMSDPARGEVEALTVGVKTCADRVPLIYAATSDNSEALANLAKENKCPLAIRADNLETLSALSDKLTAAGLKDLVLDSGSRTLRKAFEDQIFIRRAALNLKNRSLGFPTITFPCEMTKDPMKEILIAATFVSKYAGIIVLSDFEGDSLFPLLLERLNIYTDPQRPMTMQQGIYPIGKPNEDSPVLITTNFSLTYFIVSGEIESSRVPSWLLVMDTEGLSVLTAWAAGKFVGDVIGAFVKKSGITDKVKHRCIVIPGAVAAVSGDLEEELGKGWEVKIGPREAAHIPAYLKMGA